MLPRDKLSFAQWRPAKKLRVRRINPFGLCVHTSGRTILLKNPSDPVGAALRYYRKMSGAHLMADHSGNVYQMLPLNAKGAHVGISRGERRSYLNGSWIEDFSKAQISHWRKSWGYAKSPQHLYPTKSPNECYIGLELTPLLQARSDGSWFTDEQYRAVADVYRELAERYHWDRSPNRLLGHEDIDAYGRWGLDGGWDPGARRRAPRFFWGIVYSNLAMRGVRLR